MEKSVVWESSKTYYCKYGSVWYNDEFKHQGWCATLKSSGASYSNFDSKEQAQDFLKGAYELENQFYDAKVLYLRKIEKLLTAAGLDKVECIG